MQLKQVKHDDLQGKIHYSVLVHLSHMAFFIFYYFNHMVSFLFNKNIVTTVRIFSHTRLFTCPHDKFNNFDVENHCGVEMQYDFIVDKREK